jgi:hypothetical protein
MLAPDDVRDEAIGCKTALQTVEMTVPTFCSANEVADLGRDAFPLRQRVWGAA